MLKSLEEIQLKEHKSKKSDISLKPMVTTVQRDRDKMSIKRSASEFNALINKLISKQSHIIQPSAKLVQHMNIPITNRNRFDNILANVIEQNEQEDINAEYMKKMKSIP